MTALTFIAALGALTETQGIQGGRDRDMTNYPIAGNGEFGGESLFRYDIGTPGWRGVFENTLVFRPDLSYGPAAPYADLVMGLRLTAVEATSLDANHSVLDDSSVGYVGEFYFWFPARFLSVSVAFVAAGAESIADADECTAALDTISGTGYARLLDLPAVLPGTHSFGGRLGIIFSLWLLEARFDFAGSYITGVDISYPGVLVSTLHLGFGSTVWRFGLDVGSAWVGNDLTGDGFGHPFTDRFRQADTLSIGFEYRLDAHARVFTGTTFPEYDVRRFTFTTGFVFPY